MTKVPTRAGVIIIIIIISRGIRPPVCSAGPFVWPQLPYTRRPEISGRTVVVGSGVESESELTAMQTMYNSLPRNRRRHRLLSVSNANSFHGRRANIYENLI